MKFVKGLGLVFAFFVSMLTAAQAQTASPPTVPTAIIAVQQQLQPGWNLLFNPFNVAMDVVATFGNIDQPVSQVSWTVQTVWTWNSTKAKWGFYSPQLSLASNVAYANKNGYILAEHVLPGEGYWLNSAYNATMPRVVGEQFVRTSASFAALPNGWNLIGGAVIARQFNISMNLAPVIPCTVPVNFKSFWGWEAGSSKWIFYAPTLEAQGGNAGYDYAVANDLQDGTYRTLNVNSDGFWVNKTDPTVTANNNCAQKG